MYLGWPLLCQQFHYQFSLYLNTQRKSTKIFDVTVDMHYDIWDVFVYAFHINKVKYILDSLHAKNKLVCKRSLGSAATYSNIFCMCVVRILHINILVGA